MTIKQFVVRFLFASLLLLALVAMFNRIVDPFWYYRDIEIEGFNAKKPEYLTYERLIKPVLLIREQPDAIILGSSYAEIGFDPNNTFFTDNGRLKGMNLALAGAEYDEVFCNFEFAVSHAPIKRVLLGIHPSAMSEPDCKKFAKLGQVNKAELLLSISSLRDSIKTVRKQHRAKPTHTRDGQFFFQRYNSGVDIRFAEDFERHRIQHPHCGKSSKTPFDSSSGAAIDLGGLRKIIEIAGSRKIELVLFFYPLHAYKLELDYLCGDQDNSWRAMKQIARLVETEAKSAKVRLWQFYDFNELTTEAIAATANNWQDSRHFNFEMGNELLKDMFGESASGPKYGRLVTSEGIETQFQDFLRGRSAHLAHTPSFHAEIRKLQHICSDPANKCQI